MTFSGVAVSSPLVTKLIIKLNAYFLPWVSISERVLSFLSSFPTYIWKVTLNPMPILIWLNNSVVHQFDHIPHCSLETCYFN